MILKVHMHGKEIIVAACDAAILDKTLRGGGLKFHVSKKFYGEEPCCEEELIIALRRCTSANLVGEKVVAAAVRAGMIEESSIILIGKVPHAQLYRMTPGRFR